MKKLATLTIAFFTVSGAFAQPKAGTFSLTPRVAFNMANLTGNAYDANYKSAISSIIGSESSADGNIRAGFAAGVDVNYQISKHIALSTGLFYSLQGSARNYSFKIGSLEGISNYYVNGHRVGSTPFELKDKSKLSLSYLQIPILANVYLFKGFAVKAGVQPAFLLSAKDKTDISSTVKNTKTTTDVKEYFNTFDFSIPVGVSYEFTNGLMIDARYNIGVTDVVKSGTTFAKSGKSGKNSVIQISLGYKFKL